MTDYDGIIFRLEERIEKLAANESRLIRKIKELEEENRYIIRNNGLVDNEDILSRKQESFILQALKEKSKTHGLKFHELSKEEVEYLSAQLDEEYSSITKSDILAIIDKINRLGNSSNQLRKENKELREGYNPRKLQDVDRIRQLEASVANLTKDNNRLKEHLASILNEKL